MPSVLYSYTHEHTHIRTHRLAPLVQLMAFSPLREVQEKAAAALGQLAQDPENAAAIVNHHGLSYLLKKVRTV